MHLIRYRFARSGAPTQVAPAYAPAAGPRDPAPRRLSSQPPPDSSAKIARFVAPSRVPSQPWSRPAKLRLSSPALHTGRVRHEQCQLPVLPAQIASLVVRVPVGPASSAPDRATVSDGGFSGDARATVAAIRADRYATSKARPCRAATIGRSRGGRTRIEEKAVNGNRQGVAQRNPVRRLKHLIDCLV